MKSRIAAAGVRLSDFTPTFTFYRTFSIANCLCTTQVILKVIRSSLKISVFDEERENVSKRQPE